MAFLSECKLDAADAVAQIDQRCAGIGADHLVRAAEIGNPRVAGNRGDGFQRSSRGLVSRRCRPDAYQETLAGSQQRFNARAWRHAERLHARDCRGTPAASHISNGPSSQLKPARMAWSIEGASAAASPMLSAAVVPQRSEKRPQERGGFVFGRVVGQQQPQTLAKRGRVLRHIERGQRGLLRRGGNQTWPDPDTRRISLPSARASSCRSPGPSCRPAICASSSRQAREKNRPATRPAESWLPRDPGCRCPPGRPAERFRCAASPIAGPVSASTSSIVRPCFIIRSAAVNITADANAVGDKVRRVVGKHHLLAKNAVGKRGKGGQQGCGRSPPWG